jgi:protein-S-isoprenylcysteine O-methyltransferase Ste14
LLADLVFRPLAIFNVGKQVLGQELVLCNVYGAANVLFQALVFDNRSTDAANGAAVTIAGLLFAVWAREHLGSNWSRSVTIKQGHELITSGPYAVVRHPIYTGILTGLLGMAIVIFQVRGFIVFVLIFLAFWIKLRMEEQ